MIFFLSKWGLKFIIVLILRSWESYGAELKSLLAPVTCCFLQTARWRNPKLVSAFRTLSPVDFNSQNKLHSNNIPVAFDLMSSPPHLSCKRSQRSHPSISNLAGELSLGYFPKIQKWNVSSNPGTRQQTKISCLLKVGSMTWRFISAMMNVEDAQISSQALYYCQSVHMHPRLWSICHTLVSSGHHSCNQFIEEIPSSLSIPHIHHSSFSTCEEIRDPTFGGKKAGWVAVSRAQGYIFLVLIFLATQS